MIATCSAGRNILATIADKKLFFSFDRLWGKKWVGNEGVVRFMGRPVRL